MTPWPAVLQETNIPFKILGKSDVMSMACKWKLKEEKKLFKTYFLNKGKMFLSLDEK